MQNRLSKAICALAGAIATALTYGSAPVAAAAEAETVSCRMGQVVRIGELSEGSGLAASRRVPGRFWAHNDSGESATLVALDAQGGVTDRLQITGARVEDWEAIATGPCAEGSCLFVADIGDNGASRKSVTIYRIPEPSAGQKSAAAVEAMNLRYPDGAHDAEALLVTPGGDVLIVTKGETGPVAVYRIQSAATNDEVRQLERVGEQLSAKAGPEQRITDGAVSPDGQQLVLRTHGELIFFRTAEFLKGQYKEIGRVDLKSLREPQGEGVAFSSDGVYVLGEGGGGKQPGTFAGLKCEVRP